MKTKCIALEWQSGPVQAELTVVHGQLQSVRIVQGKGRVSGKGRIQAKGPVRLECRIADAQLKAGAFATRLTVTGKPHAFTCFVRDINRDHPIYIPAYGVMITEAADRRSYTEIEAEIRELGFVGKSQQIELEPEETYENACRGNRDLMCPTWLGLGRDMRFFEVGYDPKLGYWGYVQPRYHSTLQNIPESGDKPYSIGFVVGPGNSCRYDITRRLEDGVLPILRSTQREENVHYHLTVFCTLENRPLSANAVRGSEWTACYPNTGGNMLTPEEREKLKDLLRAEMRARDEETVCVIRIAAVNTERTPQYAWFKGGSFYGARLLKPAGYQSANGYGILESGRVFAIHRLNGAPMPEEEMAVLLQPGETAIFEILIPHQPLPRARAAKLSKLDFDAHLNACRKFWRAKLSAAASIHVPERAINERIQAGLLHCDITTLGKEPDGAALATIGWYSPIGSESAPIIQFFDSMGWHHLAERALQFFFNRQREDGFIQNFNGYQLETGPALWTMGEHFRYTRDIAWVKRIRPNLLKACEYLLAWRERNKKPELRGKGYGLLDGKVADPQDFFHSFMLNGLSYVGIQRVAEMLANIDPQASRRLAREAREFKQDIRAAFYEALARSPVVPIGDGTWVSSAPPWTEYPGALALYAEGGKWFTHGTFSGRDSLIGSLYLVISEVLDANELGTEFPLKSHQALMTVRNAGLSQPYYCRHDYIHLKRGEVKAFLKTYYNQFTALQDRGTYTFWEHYLGASQHKTHEEAWFLMQTRWMLWLEDGKDLRLLSAIPRAWLADGQAIRLNRVASYFGPLTFAVESQLNRNRISAHVECDGNRKPKTVLIRVPHPEGRKAIKVEGGVYDAKHETVRITPFKGKADVVIYF
ncbi:MAG: hypothetical protein PHW60_08585 [Kiritimatiellae bacterium]|nr:hypothetical protein [Kiritimatiellia bacterium]